MEVKILEVRDSATFIPVMAIKVKPENEEQRYLLERAGFGFHMPAADDKYIIAMRMVGGLQAEYDPYNWNSGVVRTMPTAHKHIIDNWDSLKDGDVVDVEFILYETKEMKVSERYG